MTDPSTSIAPLIPICLDLFSHCIEASIASHDKSAALIRQAAIDLQGRFKVWTSNVGAHQIGRSSLDYRLRDSSHLKTRIVRFLKDLSEQLSDAIALLRGTRMPLEEDAADVYDSESSDEFSSSDPTELQQVFVDIGQIMTCLYKMSMVVRNPTPHDRYVKAKEIDTSFYEPHDLRHVKEKYPTAPEYLIVRLGKAISRRRQYLKYRKLHKAKMEQLINPIGTAIVLSDTPASKVEDVSVVNGSHPRSVSDTTETSYASYIGILANTTVRLPPIPKDAVGGQHFECPYCYMIDSVNDIHAWRKHVYRDLEPFLCTFDGCSSSEQMYHSRRQWFKHEVQMHRSAWKCAQHCQQSFESREKLLMHLQKAYPEIRNHASALLAMCTNDIDKKKTSSCPLCKESVTGLTQFQKHLGHHLEELALFLLPNNESVEDEQDFIIEEIPQNITELRHMRLMPKAPSNIMESLGEGYGSLGDEDYNCADSNEWLKRIPPYNSDQEYPDSWPIASDYGGGLPWCTICGETDHHESDKKLCPILNRTMKHDNRPIETRAEKEQLQEQQEQQEQQDLYTKYRSPSFETGTDNLNSKLLVCLSPRCKYTTLRLFDLKQHQQQAHISDQPIKCINCPEARCDRHGEPKSMKNGGFLRLDLLCGHVRKVHGKKVIKDGKGRLWVENAHGKRTAVEYGFED